MDCKSSLLALSMAHSKGSRALCLICCWCCMRSSVGSTSEPADSCVTGGGGSVVCGGPLNEGMDLNMLASLPFARSTLMGCSCFLCMCDRFMVGVVVRGRSSGCLSASICSDSSEAVLRSKAEANFFSCRWLLLTSSVDDDAGVGDSTRRWIMLLVFVM